MKSPPPPPPPPFDLPPELPPEASLQPLSPRCGGALRGSSIRSLRKLFLEASQSSAFTSAVSESEDDRRDDKERAQAEEALGSERIEQNREPEKNKVDSSEGNKQHADEIRSRLFHNLGIPPKPAANDDASTPSIPPVSAQQQQQPWGPSYTEPLNDAQLSETRKTNGVVNGTDDADDDDKTPSEHQSSIAQPRMSKRKLHFDPVVQVHPIPSHVVYSDRVRNTVWAGADELAENVARNSLEFAFENWDAKQVLDEDSGRLLYYDGEWIHPAHFGGDQDNIPPAQEKELASLSSDELWRQTCERMCIQPAEYYHSIYGPFDVPTRTDQSQKNE